MNDNQSVLSLHEQGKFICYFSELDPFAGKWLGISPEKAAERAINEIKILCLVFHHVIIPPGYLIKNPAMWYILSCLKPLFEHGLLSISIDQKFISDPFLFFEQKLEEEIFHDITGLGFPAEKQNILTKQMKGLVENGYFLFRDSTVQITGFGSQAEDLSKFLATRTEHRPKALLEGIKRLKGEGLISSRDHWMALLHHPSYHPPPDMNEKITQLIHQHYFNQGWLGNHCVMYPSFFLIASYLPHQSSFPFKWFAYHCSVIAEVIARQGVDPDLLLNLPLDSFIHDLACSPDVEIWRRAYHQKAANLHGPLAPIFDLQQQSDMKIQNSISFAHTDLGKRITSHLIGDLKNMSIWMRFSVSRLRLNAGNTVDLFCPNKKTMDKIFANLPGADFLDLKTRMAYAWEPENKPGKRQYVISYQHREITRPDERKATFDRAPFQMFLALFQKHGHLLLRHEGVAIVERVTREFYGPIMLQQWDPPSYDRKDTFVLYPEMNRIVAKLKKQLEKLGLGYTLKTVRGQGWQLNTSGIDFAFKDMPVCLPDSGEPAFLSIDIDKREVRYLDKACHLGPLPFRLFQLLMRYSDVPINTRLINLELGIIAETPLSEQGYRSVQDRVRQYFKHIRKALSAIEAPVCIVSEYGIGWRLSVLK